MCIYKLYVVLLKRSCVYIYELYNYTFTPCVQVVWRAGVKLRPGKEGERAGEERSFRERRRRRHLKKGNKRHIIKILN